MVYYFFRGLPTNLVETFPILKHPQVSPDGGNSKFWLMLCCAKDNSVQYWYNIDSIVLMILWLMNLNLVAVGFSIFLCVCLFSFKKKCFSFYNSAMKGSGGFMWQYNTIEDFSPVKCSQHLLNTSGSYRDQQFPYSNQRMTFNSRTHSYITYCPAQWSGNTSSGCDRSVMTA